MGNYGDAGGVKKKMRAGGWREGRGRADRVGRRAGAGGRRSCGVGRSSGGSGRSSGEGGRSSGARGRSQGGRQGSSTGADGRAGRAEGCREHPGRSSREARPPCLTREAGSGHGDECPRGMHSRNTAPGSGTQPGCNFWRARLNTGIVGRKSRCRAVQATVVRLGYSCVEQRCPVLAKPGESKACPRPARLYATRHGHSVLAN